MIQGIIFGVSGALTALCFVVFRARRNKYLSNVIKVIALAYLAVAFFRYFLSDSFNLVKGELKLIHGGINYQETNVLQSVLRWGHFVSYVVLPMAVFFNSRLFKNIAIYFCLPFTVLSAIFFNDFMAFFMSPYGMGIHTDLWFRQLYFALELVLGITLPLVLATAGRHWFNVKDKKEWLNFFIALPFVALALIPVYIPQSLLGFTKISINALTLAQMVWLAITAVEIIVLYRVFRFKDRRSRYMLCMFLALSLFMHYNALFLMGFTIRRLPVQLCNLGAYFFVIALLIKKQAFFNFSFLANVMGTILAMVMPDMASQGFAYFWNYHYIFEHMQVLAVPALCMLLRIFPRIKANALKHLAIGFTIYFLFCWVLGTLLNGFADQTGLGTVNYFYIFNIKKAIDTLPFLAFMQRFVIVLGGRFVLYPMFQLMVYALFLGLCVLLYLSVMKLYDVLDDHFELRKAKIDLIEKITHRKSGIKREYED